MCYQILINLIFILGIPFKTDKVEGPVDFSSLDRLLTNAEKNQLTSVDRSIYNTK